MTRPPVHLPSKFIILNAQFLVFNTQFLVFNAKFITFTHRLGREPSHRRRNRLRNRRLRNRLRKPPAYSRRHRVCILPPVGAGSHFWSNIMTSSPDRKPTLRQPFANPSLEGAAGTHRAPEEAHLGVLLLVESCCLTFRNENRVTVELLMDLVTSDLRLGHGLTCVLPSSVK